MIFGRKKFPGCDWGPKPSIPIKFDFKYLKLSQVGIFDDFSLLKKFGTPEDRSNALSMKFSYYSQGFEFDAENDKIVDIFINVSDFYPPFQPFKGDFLLSGKPLIISKSTTEDSFKEIFPDVFWRDEDDDEIILFYEMEKVEWQVEFDKGGGLKALIICTPPLLSDPEAKKTFKVTKELKFKL
ncbi:hypothetical protein JXA84_09550 [candidate division WOR-3 bacterium]|nr:hypothetical protein [candidate division WOR-3 bacterium]